MNSRLTFSNHAFFNTLVGNCAARANNHRVRAVAVIRSAPVHWLEAFARQYNHEYFTQSSTTDRADRIYELLGSERLSAVVQLGRKPDHGLLAALAGTVRAGGVLIIGIPYRESVPESAGNSLKRLTDLAQRTAKNHPEQMVFVDYTPHSSFSGHGISAEGVPLNQSGLQLLPHNINYAQAAVEQDALLEKAWHHITTNARSRIVITGRRGRGKSTLMARLAARLSHDKFNTRVTAIHESALGTYYQLAENTSRYLSPELVTRQAGIDALLVDEAASFPITQLAAYADKCRHLVLCSTVEGYETAGRALALRVLPAAQTKTNSSNRQPMLQLEPEHPWRWSTGDPLEEFVDQLLLARIPSCIPELANTTPADRKRLAKQSLTRLIHRDELLSDEALLAGIHALLLSTHYQSGSKDLEHLLDAPTIQLWIQQLGNQVVGVLLLEFEGAIAGSLHDAILVKRRRLKNQLLPQLLAQMANSKAGLSSGYARILRLAVTPTLRRQGIASDMLNTVTSSLRSAAFGEQADVPIDKVDAIGASFAADERSLGFWQSQGFVEFHRGFRANPRTGKRAIAVMRCYDNICSAVLTRATTIHDENERTRLVELRTSPLPPLCNDKSEQRVAEVTELDHALLQRFALGQRSYHDTAAALQKIASRTQFSMRLVPGESQKRQEQAFREHVRHWLETKDKL